MPAKISVGTWAYTSSEESKKGFSMEHLAQKLSRMGFDGLALSGLKPQGHYELHPTTKERKELVGMFKSKGLSINSYSADLSSYPFYTGNKKMVIKYEQAYERCLEFCVDCGIPIIRIDTVCPAPYPSQFDYAKVWKMVAEMFRKNALKARQAGLTVVWEFEPGFIFNKPSEVISMVREVDMPNFKLQYDTCHAQMCFVMGKNQTGEKEIMTGGQIGFLDKAEGMIGDVHLSDSDNTLRDGRNSTRAFFGQGVINFERLIPAIIKSGYTSRWWTIDLGSRSDAWEITEPSIRYVKTLLEKTLNL